MKNNGKFIAVIPARSGSKSIKDKNIKPINGKPLIAYSIIQCFKSNIFEKVYISTDSEKYAKIAKKYGPVEIIYRPKNITKDFSTDYQMIRNLMKNININYEFIAHIRPTSPQRSINDIKLATKQFKNSGFSSLRSVHEMSESSYKSVEIKNGRIITLKKLKLDIETINKPRQKFPKTYSPNGVIDIYRKKVILKENKLYGKKVKAFITEFSQEIDSTNDLKYLQYLWRKKK